MRALVIGNCQAPGLAASLRLMRPDWEVGFVTLPQFQSADPSLNPEAWAFDRLFVQLTAMPLVERHRQVLGGEITLVPRIVFRGFHPDMVFACAGREHLATTTGPFHSALALYGFVRKLGIEATLELFRPDVFEALGYFDAFDEAVHQLVAEGERVDLPLAGAIAKWRRRGCFMYAITQPHLFVLADVARALLAREGLTPAVADPEPFLPDVLKAEAGWAIYPVIADRLGLAGDYAFKSPGGEPVRVCDLERFVTASFEVYRSVPPRPLASPGFDLARFDRAAQPQPRTAAPKAAASWPHPYRDLPSRQSWQTGIVDAPSEGPDLAADAPFKLAADERIATAGSCFAQHLGRALAARGFPRMEVEPTPLTEVSPYPARYGNIYTARQLLQLLDRAFGRFDPAEPAWQRPDGRFVDPFRPTIEAAGFADPDAVIQTRTTHLAAVRELFAGLDTLVFTLGLTEAWTTAADDAVLPLAPGVVAGRYDPDTYRFVNFDVAAVVADLGTFIERLRAVNPRARMILTVSPVPLAATYEPRHVWVSTTASKATLRTAAEIVVRDTPGVGYFPAYEIVQELDGRGLAFAADRRRVTPMAVARVMDQFVRHWTLAASRSAPVTPDPAFEAICDEDRLLPPGQS